MNEQTLPDPETLLLIALIGGAVGAFTSVGTFVLFGLARELGPALESPLPIAMLDQAFRNIGQARLSMPEEVV